MAAPSIAAPDLGQLAVALAPGGALAALTSRQQFILWRLVPGPDKPGKVPVDWRTLAIHDAHDPAIWMDSHTARTLAAVTGLQVGFVFTAADPFWFLDIDHCLGDDGKWSATAVDLCRQFAGAAVEISTSGKGLHLIGTGTVPPHSTRCSALKLELYTEGRFIALTGREAKGDAGTDHTAAITTLVAQHFPPGAASTPAEWTEGPVPEWRGPTDDDELIRRALASTSAAVAFGGDADRASFADLWNANADALGRAYPDANRAYDASRADMALAQHLTFWTGNDCERIDKLMRQTGSCPSAWCKSTARRELRCAVLSEPQRTAEWEQYR